MGQNVERVRQDNKRKGRAVRTTEERMKEARALVLDEMGNMRSDYHVINVIELLLRQIDELDKEADKLCHKIQEYRTRA